MADLNQIHDYAVKWFCNFTNPQVQVPDLLDGSMLRESEALGFTLDSDGAFSKTYPGALSDIETLAKVAGNISDLFLLGAAINSKYQALDHWNSGASEILEAEDRAWFMITLRQLACLTGDDPSTPDGDPFHFRGTAKMLRIVSNCISYGPMPQPEDEVEQHLTITAAGRVWFSRYLYGREAGKYERAEMKRFRIDSAAAKTILDAFAAVFAEGYSELPPADAGTWHLKLENTEGKSYTFLGEFGVPMEYQDTNLSELVRTALNMDNLFMMDGGGL